MDDEGFNNIISRTPVGRAGRPDEIAHLVRYICSEEAGFLNGQAIHFNGGQYTPG
jgi:NAD(P)-dependent dehydrogenase (short-subunit alcohol dehydrogenase family)